MPEQLVLPVRLNDAQSLDNFYSGPNAEIIEALLTTLRSADRPGRFYLYSGTGQGKSHLLQGLCHAQRQAGGDYLFLPLKQAPVPRDFQAQAAQVPLLCIDDLQYLGEKDAEKQLFVMLEMSRQWNIHLVFTANAPPTGLGLKMPELQTRLQQMLVYRLTALNDEEKMLALKQRAERRGFELSDDVLHYIKTWFTRDTPTLFLLLDQLDKQSLADKRRVTIPYISALYRKIKNTKADGH